MSKKDFEFKMKYEGIPIFEGKELSMKQIKKKLRELEVKFR